MFPNFKNFQISNVFSYGMVRFHIPAVVLNIENIGLQGWADQPDARGLQPDEDYGNERFLPNDDQSKSHDPKSE